jgi:lauroyl/myristoyl acyltransferase
MAKKEKRTTLGHWLQYATYRSAEKLLALMSIESIFSIGEFLGRLAYRLPLAHREIVLQNLRLAFRDEKSRSEIEALAERVFELTGANLFSSVRIPTLSDQQIRLLYQIEGLPLVEETADHGKGIVLLVPHMGNWELLAQTNALTFSELKKPIQGGTHYRPLSNPPMNRLIERRRKRRGTKLFSKRTSLHTLTSFLREGNLIGILADQRVGRRGKTCDFFGLPTDCSPLPALLAKRSGASLLALHCKTVGIARWKIVCAPVHGTDTAACTQALEKAWRSSPADVFWFQERWKYPIKRGLIDPPAPWP